MITKIILVIAFGLMVAWMVAWLLSQNDEEDDE